MPKSLSVTTYGYGRPKLANGEEAEVVPVVMMPKRRPTLQTSPEIARVSAEERANILSNFFDDWTLAGEFARALKEILRNI
ncbi:hypothetical protein DMN91_009339 [Ooceraea biroi]|uniref:Uncharacterized protein n=1 Tax=Ooceraea biroi TaxID=2015173 RepID=A0A3L8DF80_OOCBI|nr:hypothetical protein DMN91_009339 [Ooceraea biroi]